MSCGRRANRMEKVGGRYDQGVAHTYVKISMNKIVITMTVSMLSVH